MVSFRPTATQALGRGVYVGALTGIMIAPPVSLLVALGVLARHGNSIWIVIVAPVALGVVIGGAVGLALGRDEGADIDDVGIYPAPRTGTLECAQWQHVADLSTQRHGGRTWVAVHLDDGRVARLPAPYDGRWLCADHQFERKVFVLRHLWEMHRSFAPDTWFRAEG
jgi:hypothetical protein